MQRNLVIRERLDPLDWWVFAGVLLLTVAAVVYGNWRQRRLQET